jgi:Arc/MetJ-type ribon-helix-helix transcriptional regulator
MKGGLYKMSTIISVSLSSKQKEFIDEMAISPSELIQRSIDDLIESSKVSQKQVQELTRRIASLQEVINKYRDFIETEGLMDKFMGL